MESGLTTEHGKLIEYVNDADDIASSKNLSLKCRDYYNSEQWSDAEKQKLKKQKQAPTVINRCKPKVDSMLGMERANRTTAKAQPRTPKHAPAAVAATEAVRFCLQDNMYERGRSEAWENMLIEGTGGLDITVKPKGDSYKILIKHVMWDRLIWDPHSRRKDFSDAKYLGQVIWLDYDEALSMYPEAKDILEDMQSGSQIYDDKPRWMDRKRVKIVELYYRKDNGDWWYACFTRGGFCKNPMISPYRNEEGETESCYEFASLFVDSDGGRYGSLKQVLDVQDEINKRRSKALHLMSVRQTFGNKGSVEDLNKARAELAKPDGHLETAYGEFGKDFGVLPTGDMAKAQFDLLMEAKTEMDAVGANAATQGKDTTVQSGVALRQRALTGQTELAPMFDMLKNLDIRVYRKVWNRIKQYWKAEMWLRVTDDENNLKFVGLNKPITKGEQILQQAQAEGAPPEVLAQLQQQISQDPMMMEVVSTENDIANLDVDIIMDDAPDTVTQEVEDFQAMAEMVKSGFPIPPEAVIMSSPLSNKDKIIKMMKEKPQIPEEVKKQLEEMQEALQKGGEEMQKLNQENQALKQDNTAEQMKVSADRESEMEKAQIKREQMDAEFSLKQEAQQREATLAREEAVAKFELEKFMMLEKHKLEREMAELDNVLEKDKMSFEQQRHNDDMTKHKEDVERSEAPKVVKEMTGMSKVLQKGFEGLEKGNERIVEILEELLKAQERPRTIALSNIQKDANGSPIGATVKPTLQ